MKRAALVFDRPDELQASAPPSERGIQRDEVRLLVSSGAGHTHAPFCQLAHFLQPDDLIVVNQSATLAASLPAHSAQDAFILNLSTDYGRNLWLAEPRWSPSQPGPLPLSSGDVVTVANLSARLIAPYPRLPRLWFVAFDGQGDDVMRAMRRHGQPIRYGYVETPYPLSTYQTLFSTVPGSAEMPSAAHPFTPRVLAALKRKGVQVASIVLHTGVSSLEVEVDDVEDHPLYPEPFTVPITTARAVNAARRAGRRVIAVGTTVVRALETAWDGEKVRPATGFTRVYVHPQRGVYAVDGLLTGLHDPVTSHLAMLYAIAGESLVRSAYAEAVRCRYLWHEFGDSHLILPPVRQLATRAS
jgi:S-adenosylmethionine:tRNA ribosyltransferase-isomerase